MLRDRSVLNVLRKGKLIAYPPDRRQFKHVNTSSRQYYTRHPGSDGNVRLVFHVARRSTLYEYSKASGTRLILS